MRPADLDAVTAIAAIGFPDHFEGRECFADRLELYPVGCFVLEGEAGVAGYLVAYPWRRGSAPALNTVIGAIPAEAEVLYLHDLALLPEARGGGWTRPILERLVEHARGAGLAEIALVAVNDAAGFWERHGFRAVDDPGMVEKLASYGAEARYMMRG